MEPSIIVLLTRKIAERFNCQCRFLHAQNVIHTENSRILWQGRVATFAIRRGPESDICFVWLDGASRGAAAPVMVLKTWSIHSPASAVAWHLRQQAVDTQCCPI